MSDDGQSPTMMSLSFACIGIKARYMKSSSNNVLICVDEDAK
jgi:hypothetical protein